ncbi:hypothetical protein ES332_D02G102400v1 [Gossypium tomentosum]|uniref:protein disulfide-isomerase n=1 Tax=Gossypium tomentosum TaxID=34277 RepID=A0A5D2LVG8_GOSTO|nr:hypothetical protein ES332_D02G102400v1 [Gossypium tomentosum]
MARNFFVWFALAAILCSLTAISAKVSESKEFVLTLDHSNFTRFLTQHNFVVVKFYAPWCRHSQNLAPEYEKAASVLSNHHPPIILAKFDADDEANKYLAKQYRIRGYPTVKIFRNGGQLIQEYRDSRRADYIVEYLKEQISPASVEIKSAEDASGIIPQNKITILFYTRDLLSGLYCGSYREVFWRSIRTLIV